MNSPIIVSYPDGFVAGYNELSIALNACTGRGNCLVTVYPILVEAISDWKDYPTTNANADITIPADTKIMFLPNAIFTGTHSGSTGQLVDLNNIDVPVFYNDDGGVPENISILTGSVYINVYSDTQVRLMMRGGDGVLRQNVLTMTEVL